MRTTKTKGKSHCLWPLGVHAGTPVEALPDHYIVWALSFQHIPEPLKCLLRWVHKIDLPEDDTQPDPASAAVVLPGVVWEWEQHMLARFGGDLGAAFVVEVGLEKLKELTTEYTRRAWPEGGAA